MSSAGSESDYDQLDHLTYRLPGSCGAAKSPHHNGQHNVIVSEENYNKFRHRLPRSYGAPAPTYTEYLNDFVKVGDVVDEAGFNRFLQERRVKDMQLCIDALEESEGYEAEEELEEEGELFDENLSTQVCYSDTEDHAQALHQLVSVSKTTGLVLDEVLQLVLDVQRRIRGLEQRVCSLEREVTKSPQPKTSCGFSCSNNSVTID